MYSKGLPVLAGQHELYVRFMFAWKAASISRKYVEYRNFHFECTPAAKLP